MSSRNRLEKPLTGSARLAAYSLLLLLAFLAAGCQRHRIAAAPASLAAASSACGEGMLAAQAWKCLASGTARP
jgi:hypothetical protein